MKQRKRWLGLAFAPFALAMFALAQPAHAADYTGNCALMPNHVTGDANVNDSACIISSDLTVDGSLTINATSVDAKNINAGGNITINTSSGNIKTFQLINAAGDIKVASGTGDVETRKISAGTSVQVTAGLAGGVTSKIVVTQPIVINKTQDTEGHGNVILRARGNISTSTIRTDGELGAASLKAGAIQIDSNLAGGSTEFVIGGSGAANGVNGSIITRTTVGGGTDTIYTFHGVRITNGGFNSTGGITVTSMANIQVTATQSRAGWIELNAQNGILKLPSGKLNAEGANPLGTDPGPSYTGGAIYLLAKEIQTESGAIISARQAPGATPTLHQIALATETVTLKGENGLRILNDGDGVPESFGTIMVPQFGLTPTSNNSLNDLKWGFLGDLSLSTHKTLLVNGISDRSPFRLSSDGSNQGVAISGYPLAFKTGVLDISARGAENHKIKLGYFGVPDGGSLGVQIDTTLTATIDASGKDGNGGVLDIAGDGFDILHTPLLRLLATGPSSGDGDGGQVKIKVNDITLSSTPETKVQIDGSAATAGSGNAIVSELSSDDPQAIKIETAANTSLIFGSAKGMFSLQANGGFVGGNAGGIKVELGGENSKISIRNHERIVQAAALNEDGNAGKILISAKDVPMQAQIGTNNTVPTIVATGGSNSGEGGTVEIPHLRAVNNTAPDSEEILVNVATAIKVDGAPSRDPNIFDGQISINGVVCR
ncbi:MAG: hypothetical protein EKK48_24610 [Candidatus Melainabacteria bacterium]|nr:MAG: hypothetical protein EKK48_24610 [Candidatus Melainabacteria bacterium]